MINNSAPKSPVDNEHGIALITTLLFLVVVAIMATTAMTSGIFETRHTSQFKGHQEARYIADAGLEYVRKQLPLVLSTKNLSQLLDESTGPNGVLVNSDHIANFNNVDDIPVATDSSFGVGSYRVYLTNDSAEGVQNITDVNGKVTLTSVGVTPAGSRAVTQMVVYAPLPPAGISLPGNLLTFTPGSGSVTYSGGLSKPAIAVNTAGSHSEIVGNIHPSKVGNFTGGGVPAPSVVNTTIKAPWDVPSLENLFTTLASVADHTTSAAPGFSLGTSSSPKVVVITGNFAPSTGGSGILAVKGRLYIPNGFTYTGLIVVLGEGEVITTNNGGGSRTIDGGLVVADTSGDGTSVFDIGNGGGNLEVHYNENAIFKKFTLPMKIISWRRLL